MKPEDYVEACIQQTMGGSGRGMVVMWAGTFYDLGMWTDRIGGRSSPDAVRSFKRELFPDGAERCLTRLEARMDPADMTEDIRFFVQSQPESYYVFIQGR